VSYVSKGESFESREEKKMLTYLYVYLKTFLASLRDEEGADLAEYALLLALIAVVAILAITLLGQNVRDIFGYIANQLAPPS